MKLKLATVRKKGMGISAVSLVEKPAIQVKFICLSEQEKDKEIQIVCSDKEKHIVMGPLMMVGKAILRDEETMSDEEEGYVYWNAATIASEQVRLFKEKKNLNVKLNHNQETDDAVMIGCWLIEDPKRDKTAIHYPEGTFSVGDLIGEYKILTDSLWTDVKAGKYNGFSVEGLYALEDKGEIDEEKAMSMEENEEEITLEQLVNIISESIIEAMVKPEPGESEKDFISRCIPIEVDAGHESKQAQAICFSKWEMQAEELKKNLI